MAVADVNACAFTTFVLYETRRWWWRPAGRGVWSYGGARTARTRGSCVQGVILGHCNSCAIKVPVSGYCMYVWVRLQCNACVLLLCCCTTAVIFNCALLWKFL